MTSRYAVIDATGLVTNIILWDGDAEWQPPDGQTSLKLPDGSPIGPGWTQSGGNFVPPPAPAPLFPSTNN